MVQGKFQGDPKDAAALMQTLNRYHRERQSPEGVFIGFREEQMQTLRQQSGNKDFWKTPEGQGLARELKSQIDMFQEDLGFQRPDGQIAPDKRTHQALNQLNARHASQDALQAQAAKAQAASQAQAAKAQATADFGPEIRTLPTIAPKIDVPSGPLASSPSPTEVNRVANGLLLRNPIQIEIQTTDKKTLTINALEARDLYLNLHGFNSDGISTHELAQRGRDPFVRSGGSFGTTPEDGANAARDLREDALKRLASLGLNERQFSAILNDAQTLREALHPPHLPPQPFALVQLQISGYDLKKAGAVSPSHPPSGLLPTSRAKALDTHLSLKDLTRSPDPQIANATREIFAGAKDGHSYHPGLKHEDFTALDRLTSAKIGQAFQAEDAPKAVQDYRKLLELQAAHAQGKLPEDFKKHLDIEKLRQKLEAPPQEVLDLFQTAQKDALTDLKKLPGRQGLSERIQQHADYLTSDSFQQRLALYDTDGERSKVIQAEVQALAAFDPSAAHQVVGTLALRSAADHTVDLLQAMSPQERQTAIEQTLAQTPEAKNASPAEIQAYAKDLAHFYSILPPGTSASRASEILDKAGQGSKGTADLVDSLKFDKALRGVDGEMRELLDTQMKKHSLHRALAGKMSVLSGALAIGAVVTKTTQQGWPPNAFEWSRDLAATSKGIGILAEGAEQIGERLGKTGLQNFGKAAKILGPLGDAVGLGAGIYDLSQDLQRGDHVGAFFKGVGAASSLVGVAAGLIALSGGTLAPVVGAAATIVGIGAWIGDQVFGESDNTLLQDLGVYRK